MLHGVIFLPDHFNARVARVRGVAGWFDEGRGSDIAVATEDDSNAPHTATREVVSRVTISKLASCRAALLQSVAVSDPVECINLGHFAALASLFQGCGGLFEAGVAGALNCVAILMNLEERRAHGFVTSFEHVCLSMVEKKIKSTAGSFPHNSDSSLTEVLGARHFGCEQAAIQMRLQARLSSAKGALLPRFGQTHRAPHS